MKLVTLARRPYLGASVVTAGVAIGWTSPSLGGLTTYSSIDTWSTAANQFTTITFTEVPAFTIVTDQYLSLGVEFTDDDLNVTGLSGGFLDGAGVNGLAMIEGTFGSPIKAVAFHHPGFLKFRLYLGDTFVGQTGYLGGGGPSFFSGVVSTQWFDRMQVTDVLSDPIDPVFVDNMYFSTIPAPGASCVLLSLLVRPRRRR